MTSIRQQIAEAFRPAKEWDIIDRDVLDSAVYDGQRNYQTAQRAMTILTLKRVLIPSTWIGDDKNKMAFESLINAGAAGLMDVTIGRCTYTCYYLRNEAAAKNVLATMGMTPYDTSLGRLNRWLRPVGSLFRG